MASGVTDEQALLCVEKIRRQAEELGRNPDDIGFQLMLQPPPRSDEDKAFYANLDAVAERSAVVRAMGFDWTSVNATALFQAGARSVDAMIEQLDVIHSRIRREIG
jgi:alkanesulfonate monooxygenase SsuD/methylene tetrahydromethanopterin reductase-like flavin-dependent oxidoreductase (luciferase family)